MSSSTLCYVSASNCESVCGLATVGISWHENCESTTHALSHTQTRTRTHTHIKCITVINITFWVQDICHPHIFQHVAVTITARVNRLLPDVCRLLYRACRCPCMCFFVRKCWLAPHACLNSQSAVICCLSACCSTSREDCDFHHCCHRHCGQENCHRWR